MEVITPAASPAQILSDTELWGYIHHLPFAYIVFCSLLSLCNDGITVLHPYAQESVPRPLETLPAPLALRPITFTSPAPCSPLLARAN